MTLRKLHERVGQIMDWNSRNGWPERNNMDVLIEISVGKRKRKIYVPLIGVSGSALVTERGTFMSIIGAAK